MIMMTVFLNIFNIIIINTIIIIIVVAIIIITIIIIIIIIITIIIIIIIIIHLVRPLTGYLTEWDEPTQPRLRIILSPKSDSS